MLSIQKGRLRENMIAVYLKGCYIKDILPCKAGSDHWVETTGKLIQVRY